ncbi:hypothetical protein K0M31_012693 [Melipona bicolor]|uniref:Uncharacterized protein n=1 Tax=Melipona bicolor TaxID=60889 RepID=A0AA40FJ92_9HYME|nr:hypothetical protein K0M31_012693 [Melipona bicolor]
MRISCLVKLRFALIAILSFPLSSAVAADVIGLNAHNVDNAQIHPTRISDCAHILRIYLYVIVIEEKEQSIEKRCAPISGTRTLSNNVFGLVAIE